MWTDDLARLKKVYIIYLATWLAGSGSLIRGISAAQESGSAWTSAGVMLLLVALIAYIFCLIFSYQVQKGMNDAGLSTHHPAHIIVAGLIFNPCIVGFWIPLSVMLAARKALKRAAQPPPPLPSP
jgi:hypothetical protein